jgi:hypothetical protein
MLKIKLDAGDARQALIVLETVIAQGEAELPDADKRQLAGYQTDNWPPDAIRIVTQLYAVKALRLAIQRALLDE